MFNFTTYDDYLTCREQLLQKFSSSQFGESHGLETSDLKQFYRDLRKAVIDKGYPAVTNVKNHEFNYFDLNIYSRYQRQGHKFIGEGKHVYEMLYGATKQKQMNLNGFFTSSCQVGNYTLLNVLKSVFPDSPLYHPTEVLYFESLFILNRLRELSNFKGNGKKIYFLDSTGILDESTLLEFANDPASIELIIFDTTCYDRQSEFISRVVDRACELKLPIVMTRSHLKLDSFGWEYGSLGSLLFINFPERTLYEQCHEYLSQVGGFAFLDQIYPFLFDQSLKDLNSWRVEQIRKNNLYISNEVKKNNSYLDGWITSKHHQLFHLAIYDRSKNEILKIGERFVALCKVYDLEAYFCDSFGFDFFSLTHFDSVDFHGNGCMRFCSPVNKDEVEKSILIVNKLIQYVQR